MNEQVLSQKLDQLSPFSRNHNEKQQSSRDFVQGQSMIGINFDFIPDYLSKTNKSFEKKIYCILPSTINLEELRDIATLMHKIMSIEIVHSLWIIYQKSGEGNLPSTTLPTTNQIDRKIWPIQVQSLMKKQSPILPSINDHNACLTFINHCLHELNMKSNQYRHELKVKASRLHGYTHSLECTIEKFIKQNLECSRIDIDQQIASVQYDYTEQILKRAYLSQNPNENQVSLFELFVFSYILLSLFVLDKINETFMSTQISSRNDEI